MYNPFNMEILKTQTFYGTKVEIRVREDGEFYARAAGEHYKSDTLKGLVSQLEKVLKKTKAAKLAIPVTMLGVGRSTSSFSRGDRISGHGTCDMILVGLHTANGNVIVREDRADAKNEQLTGYTREFARRLTREESDEYTRLSKAESDAKNALYEFTKRVELDVEKVVKKALGDLIDDPKEAPQDDPGGDL